MDTHMSPWLMITLLIITTLTISFYNSLTRSGNKNKNLKKNQKPQLPEADGGWPFIGHLRLLSGARTGPDLPHITLSDMADKHGPVFSIRLGMQRALVVSSSEAAKECFTAANDVIFSNRPKTSALEHMTYNFAMFVFSPYGSYWRELRKITTQNLLSSNRVAMLGDTFEIEIGAMMRKLLESCGDDEKVEMKKVLGNLTYGLMVRVVAGDIENKKIRDRGGKNDDKFREGLTEFFRLMGVVTITDAFPFLKWFGGFTNSLFKSTGKKMDGFVQAWLDNYKKHYTTMNINSDDEKNESLMATMMAVSTRLSKDFPEYGPADTITKAACQGMMLAGTDTMTVILTWAVSLVLNNPHTLTRAQQELDLCVGRERRVKSSDVQNLVYIKAVIKETFRLYAPPLGTPRVAAEDCTVAGFHVPAGTILMVNVWKLHRDPRVWADPLEFRPERFLTGHKEVDVRGQHFELIPLGSGRRVCPGITFSLQFMELALASLLHGFDIERPSRESIDMTGSLGASNKKATPLEVRIAPRLSSPSLYA